MIQRRRFSWIAHQTHFEGHVLTGGHARSKIEMKAGATINSALKRTQEN